AAYLITRWLTDPTSENGTEMDSFFGWDNETDEDRMEAIGQDKNNINISYNYPNFISLCLNFRLFMI
ncbi:MAG: hypothetical protein II034_03555, partial [Muribaculaceae bacterium]|nr:hypothetical protein [Muribaculaceae bacterium]